MRYIEKVWADAVSAAEAGVINSVRYPFPPISRGQDVCHWLAAVRANQDKHVEELKVAVAMLEKARAGNCEQTP